MMKKFHRAITTGAYFVFTVLLLGIIGLTIANPGNHLIPWQMLLGTMAVTLLLIAGSVAWNRIYDRIGKQSRLYLLCLVLFGIALFVTSLGRQGNADTFTDYSQVYNAAWNLAEGKSLENTYYFLIYSNNLKPMLLLSLLFRCADFFHVARFAFILAVNVLQVLLVVWSCGYLPEKDGDTRWRFPVLVLFVFFLPAWGMVSAFYTDSMSFGLGIICLAFWKKAQQSDGKKSVPWLFTAAFALNLAVAWKITAVIPAIAGVVVLLWQRVRCSRKKVVIFFTAFLAFYLGMNLWADSYDVTGRAKVTANPVISWVALGMREDGSYINNKEYVDYLNTLQTTEEKKSYTLEYMRENKDALLEVSHWTKKLSRNFADGNLGVRDFLFIEYDDGTLLWNLFSPWGKYYWRTSQYCFCYLVSMYVLLLLGSLCCLRKLICGGEAPTILMICQLAFLGIFLFLMLWEANSRQLYNQMPGILLGAVSSLQYFQEIIIEKKRCKSV